MTTQQKPDTSREGAWRYEINYGPDGEENYANVYDQSGTLVGNLKIQHAIAVVRALASSPAPSRANAEHERAEGLAKEVERLTNYVENNDYIGGWRKRAEAAEAKLAVYEAPVEDGEIEGLIAALSDADSDTEATAWLVTAAQRGASLIRRLSATVAQREEEIAKLREALAEIISPLAAMKRRAEAHGNVLSGVAYSIVNNVSYLQGIARAALSEEEGA